MNRAMVCQLCSCQKATKCCLCTPARFYICAGCLPNHTSKGSLHLITSASVPPSVTSQSLQAYTAKVDSAKQYLNVLAGWEAQLQLERSGLRETVYRLYNEQITYLWKLWDNASREIDAFFDRVQADLEKVRTELNSFEETETVPLSQETLQLLNAGIHDRPSNYFLEVESYGNSAIKVFADHCDLPANDCLLGIIQTWDEIMCECTDCCTARANILGPEGCQKVERRYANSWSPQDCSAVNRDSVCSAADPDCDLSVSRGRPSALAYNPFLTVESLPGELLPASAPVPASQPWTCERCWASTNPSSEANCQRCTRLRGAWMCWECGRDSEPLYEACKHCGMAKAWKEYLLRKKVELSAEQDKWRCKRCRGYNGLEQENCGECGKEEEAVKKGKRGQGRKAGFLGVIRSAFS